MGKWRRIGAAIGAVFACAVAAGVILRAPDLPDENRHVVSNVTSLARYGPDDASIWVYITSRRDFKIRPDGSGAIAEEFLDRSFPSPEQEQLWRASSQDPYEGVNQDFGPGDLFYIKANEVRAGVTDISLKMAPAGDALRRIASLIGETAASEPVQQAALDSALALNGVQIQRSGSQVRVTGVTGDHGLEITLVFEMSPARLVSEVRKALIGRPGLNIAVPYVVFERTILESETIAHY